MYLNAFLTAHHARNRGLAKPACSAVAHSKITYTYLLYGLGRHFPLMHDLDNKHLVAMPCVYKPNYHSMMTESDLFNSLGRHFAFMHDLHYKDLVISPPPALEGFAESPLAQLLHRLILDVEGAPECHKTYSAKYILD